jgi:hypothetical protein
MVLFKGVIFLGLMILIAVSPTVKAEVWQLGYRQPVVEEILASESGDSDEIRDPVDLSDEPLETAEEKPETKPEPKSEAKAEKKIGGNFSRISTAKNTFGVETIENGGSKFYLSPVFGFASVYGNNTITVNPQYAYGGRLGYLFMDSLMIEAGYLRTLISTSAPIVGATGFQPQNAFDYQQGILDVGAKLFFLGRESRLRPFVMAGLSYASSSLNYASAYSAFNNLGEFKIKQLQGSGQVGLEFAITRTFVATAAFQMSAILTHQASAPTSTNQVLNGLESSRITAGNSLSHSANFSGNVGLGVYF